MTDLALNNNVAFDFSTNGVEVMTLETLERTHRENDVYGKPIKGIYHFQVIRRIVEMCEKYNLNYEVEEIFAAQNKNKDQPGVAILPFVEEKLGERAVEAHILRRIYTTVQIKNWETEELTTTLCIAYHQNGIQAAIGPCVKICHNQCILGPERSVANYGKNGVITEELFDRVDGWLRDFEQEMTEDRERIRRMKEKVISPVELYAYVGLLTALRVSHDSKDERLNNKVDTYPLNQSQISDFTENLLLLNERKKQITAWDVYNVATEIYKPEKTVIPAMIPQNSAMAKLLLIDNPINEI